MVDYNNENVLLQINLPALHLMALHGYICLGLRHPKTTGPSRDIVLHYIDVFETLLLNSGLLDEDDVRLIHKVEMEESKKY